MADNPYYNRWLAFGEILVIFALFTLQGAWPVPDVNEAHYLGKAAHFWNPEWIRGDFFLDSADSHKVFYFTFGWLTLWLPLPAVAWTGRLITWWLLAWSWRRLSIAILSPSPSPPAPLPLGEGSFMEKMGEGSRFGWSILTAALFVMLNERFQMAGEWFIGGVEAKGFAYVLMLLGLEAFVKNRWNRAWLLFGASAGIHALVGGWAVVAAGVAWILMRNNRPKFCSMLPGLLGGFLLSLPGLIPALALSRNIDVETIRQANVIYVFERLRHHLDIFQFKMEFLYRFAALTVCYLVLCRMLKKSASNNQNSEHPEQAKETIVKNGFWRSICNLQFAITNLQSSKATPLVRLQAFVAGALVIALFGIVIDLTSLYDRTFAAGLLRFYWFRLADIALPLGTAFVFTYWIQEKLTSSPHLRPLSQRARGGLWAKLGLITAVVLVGIHFASYIPERIKPGPARADRLKHVAAWQDACRWASENTPADARFFTPRLSQTFKWYARRAEVATWKDVPQDAGALVAWWNRIQAVFATGSPQPEFRWRENASEMELPPLKKLARKYAAEYIIAPLGNRSLDLEVAYRNEGYIIYRIPREKAAS